MKYRKLRIAWSVGWGVVAVMLITICFAFQYRDTNVELMRRGGPGPTNIRIHTGKLWLSWDPRAPYRPKWAGQTNHYGFRYNMYSSGTWNLSGPLWVVGVLLATAGASFAAVPWLRSLRYRFSLRTLLIGTTLIAVVLGIIVWMTRAG